MRSFKDIFHRQIRFTDERLAHIETDHPEMHEQVGKIDETLLGPEIVVRSKVDHDVELF